jgi:hypothetical protein
MKLLKHTLLILVAVIGFALTASAQDNREERKKPPKENAEIKPEEKNKPRNNENQNNNNQNNSNKGKKPQKFFFVSENRIEITSI